MTRLLLAALGLLALLAAAAPWLPLDGEAMVLDAILAPVFAQRPSAHWLKLLEDASIPCGAIRTVTQALSQAEVVTHDHPSGGPPVRSIPLPFTIEGAPRASTRRAPQLGEHTAEILSEWLEPDDER